MLLYSLYSYLRQNVFLANRHIEVPKVSLIRKKVDSRPLASGTELEKS